MITHGENLTKLSTERVSDADHHSCLDDLHGCKDYIFYVSSVSVDGLPGGTDSIPGSTEETGE